MTSERDSPDGQSGPPEPLAETGGRIASLDFIRGIAVMGILAANIVSMGQPQSAYAWPGAFTTGHSEAEDWMWVAQLVLVDGKMRGLFTLLFGAGLYLFMEKAWARGATRLLQARRLLWLALFGLFHFYFIWQGDILFAYAVSGLVAIFFLLDLEPREQAILGVLGYIAGGIFYASTLGMMQYAVDGPEPDNVVMSDVRSDFVAGAEADLADGRVETAIRQDGSYGELVAHTFAEHGWDPTTYFFDFAFETLPLMLIGMALFRKGLFTGAFAPRRLRRWGWGLLIAGGALTGLIGVATKAGGLTYYGTMAAIMGWSHFPRLMMTLGLLALLVLYAPKAGSALGERIAAAGRVAFSNYLGTSVVMLFVFGNWGLDLFGRLGRSELYLVTLAAWIVMLAWSQAWLTRYRYGPLEWLWRCLTYGKIFAIRR